MNTFIPVSGLQNANTPITVGGKIGGNVGKAGQADSVATSFKSLFEDAVTNVEQLDQVKSADSYNLAIGDMDDLAGMMINSQRAETSFQLMVEIRNKVLDAYTEIMRMNV